MGRCRARCPAASRPQGAPLSSALPAVVCSAVCRALPAEYPSPIYSRAGLFAPTPPTSAGGHDVAVSLSSIAPASGRVNVLTPRPFPLRREGAPEGRAWRAASHCDGEGGGGWAMAGGEE